jgi:hypothetical protein
MVAEPAADLLLVPVAAGIPSAAVVADSTAVEAAVASMAVEAVVSMAVEAVVSTAAAVVTGKSS